MQGEWNRDVHGAQAGLFNAWKAALAGGAIHFGWKIGINDPRARRFYGLDDSVVGYLTDHSVIDRRRDFESGTLVMAEPELALRIGSDVEGGAEAATLRGAIAEVAPALEILNFNQPRRTLEEVMGHNIFHEGVALGSWKSPELGMQSFVECRKDGEVLSSARAPQTLPPLEAIVGLVARTLESHGERLRGGEVIISGAMTPAISLEAGQALAVGFSGLGLMELNRDEDGGVVFSDAGTHWS